MTSIRASHAPVDFYSEEDASASYATLLARDDITALIIALPILAQPAFVKAALDAGKHVLAEKPIAADVAKAQDLIAHAKGAKGTLAIAENFRFNPAYIYAAEQARALGKVTHFSARAMHLMADTNKYYHTSWRKTPEYQGGFLLDGGVHNAALTRLFLSGENRASKVRAMTEQFQPHLPPVDTLSAIVKTASGAVGTYTHSAGTTSSAWEWDFAMEKGAVRLEREKVTVSVSGQEDAVKTFGRTSGVSEEVAAWSAAMERGEQDPLQSAEEALADLEFLEMMFDSGNKGGEEREYALQL